MDNFRLASRLGLDGGRARRRARGRVWLHVSKPAAVLAFGGVRGDAHALE